MKISVINSVMVLSILSLGSGLAISAEYDADSLDRLFTDRGQRAQIDAARSGGVSTTGVKKVSKIELNGYVTRSEGKSVVWVNGKNTLDSTRVDDVSVHQTSVGKNKKVTVSVDGKHKRLRPGEIWHKETGKVVEGY